MIQINCVIRIVYKFKFTPKLPILLTRHHDAKQKYNKNQRLTRIIDSVIEKIKKNRFRRKKRKKDCSQI